MSRARRFCRRVRNRARSDLIYRAAAAPDDAEARGLAGEALARMRARGARFFTGENAKLSELEDIS